MPQFFKFWTIKLLKYPKNICFVHRSKSKGTMFLEQMYHRESDQYLLNYSVLKKITSYRHVLTRSFKLNIIVIAFTICISHDFLSSIEVLRLQSP